MPSADDLHVKLVVQLRTRILFALGHFCECAEHVDRRDALRHRLPARNRRTGPTPQRLEQLPLARLDPFRRRQHLLFVRLERRCHIALGTSQCLATLIVVGHEMLVRVRDLEVISEHAIEADLERADARARALLRLNRRDRIFAAVAQRAQLVEFRVDAGRDRVFFADRQRRSLDQRACQLFGALRAIIPFGQQLTEHTTVRRSLRHVIAYATRRVCDLRQSRERIAKRAQLARRGTTCGGLARQTFDVTHTVQRLAQCRASDRIAYQHGDRVQSLFDRVTLHQRREQPLPKQSLPHWRRGPIHHGQQRARQFATT